MASTCAANLALMHAGVPMKKHVAGIAMGLASNDKKWKVLTDLQDLEDGNGGMDFKFTSTKDGITAVQMDTKTRGLNIDMIKATIPQMRKAIDDILKVMKKAIKEPSKDLSEFAPRIITFYIDPEKIRDVIGPGGKVISAITAELDLKIDMEDDGQVLITTYDAENGKKAEKKIREIVREIEVGDLFEEAECVKIMPFGAFINLTPGKDGFLHVSEIEWGHVNKVTDRVNMGDKIRVKVTKIDRGKIDVSMKVLTPKPEGYVEKPRRPRQSSGGRDRRGPPRGGGRGGDRRGGGGGRDRRSGGGERRH
jgi:polyribonucleotide nucleotidyltransferase